VCARGPKPHKGMHDADAWLDHKAIPNLAGNVAKKWVRGVRFVCMHRWALPSIHVDSFRWPGSNTWNHWMCSGENNLS
jgi:hypothetical protein